MLRNEKYNFYFGGCIFLFLKFHFHKKVIKIKFYVFNYLNYIILLGHILIRPK
jgi:hypothetical protein